MLGRHPFQAAAFLKALRCEVWNRVAKVMTTWWMTTSELGVESTTQHSRTGVKVCFMYGTETRTENRKARSLGRAMSDSRIEPADALNASQFNSLIPTSSSFYVSTLPSLVVATVTAFVCSSTIQVQAVTDASDILVSSIGITLLCFFNRFSGYSRYHGTGGGW